jgi:hypothetical protein
VDRKLKLRRDLVPMVADYGFTFGSDQGKRVLDDLVISFGGSCYSRGDAYHTAFLEGQREVLLRIKQMISYSGCEIEEEVENDA